MIKCFCDVCGSEITSENNIKFDRPFTCSNGEQAYLKIHFGYACGISVPHLCFDCLKRLVDNA